MSSLNLRPVGPTPIRPIYDTNNAVEAFSHNNPSGRWTYGWAPQDTLTNPNLMGNSTKPGFTPYTVGSQNTQGTYAWTDPKEGALPTIGKNESGAIYSSGTVVEPTDVLLMHPSGPADAIVQWTAPRGCLVDVHVYYELLDTNPTGVFAYMFHNDGCVQKLDLSLGTQGVTAAQTTPTLKPGNGLEFYSILAVSNGDILSFGVNSNGSYFDDLTGLRVTINELIITRTKTGLIKLVTSKAG
jgi:hypothetical protein